MAGRGLPSRREPGAGQRQFCADLRHWRTLRGLSQQHLARLVLYSREWVTKVEQGERWPTEDFARRADAALDTGGVLMSRWPLVAAEWAAAAPPRGPRPLAPVLPLWQRPDSSAPDVPASGDPLAAMVATVLRDCPGARIVIVAMDGDVSRPAVAGDRDGHAPVIELADFRTGTARRRTSGGPR